MFRIDTQDGIPEPGVAAVSLLGSPEGKDLDGMMFDRLSLFA